MKATDLGSPAFAGPGDLFDMGTPALMRRARERQAQNCIEDNRIRRLREELENAESALYDEQRILWQEMNELRCQGSSEDAHAPYFTIEEWDAILRVTTRRG